MTYYIYQWHNAAPDADCSPIWHGDNIIEWSHRCRQINAKISRTVVRRDRVIFSFVAPGAKGADKYDFLLMDFYSQPLYKQEGLADVKTILQYTR